VSDSADKYNLGSITAGSLLRANIDLNITANSRDAVKVIVVLETAKFEQMVEGRAHSATKRVFVESVTLRE
jgi:hypothetical protein